MSGKTQNKSAPQQQEQDEPQEQPTQNRPRQAPKRPPPQKSNRFSKPFPKKSKPNESNVKDGKNNQASFEKKADITTITTYCLLPVYELFTSTFGLPTVCKLFYNILRARDAKMTAIVSELDLTYTVLLCAIHRMITITNHFKTTIIFHSSDLRTIVKDVLLPDALATYVETLGMVTLSNGTKVIPYFRGYTEMIRTTGFLDPIELLRQMEPPLEPSITEWALNPQPVIRWMNASTRALKNAMDLRSIKYDEIEGRPEFLANGDIIEGNLHCTAVDKIDQNQCQLGAAYRFRDSAYQLESIGLPLPTLFGASPTQLEMVLSAHFRKALRAEK